MRILITAVAALAFASPVMAQGWIEPSPGIRCECSVQRTRTSVSVRVTGRVARVEVEEWFRNQGGILGQGDYLYPLPGEAVSPGARICNLLNAPGATVIDGLVLFVMPE